MDDPMAQMKAQLLPRVPGENVKLAETVLRKRRRGGKVQEMAQRALDIREVARQRRRNQYSKGIITLESLVKESRQRVRDAKRVHRLFKAKSQMQKSSFCSSTASAQCCASANGSHIDQHQHLSLPKTRVDICKAYYGSASDRKASAVTTAQTAEEASPSQAGGVEPLHQSRQKKEPVEEEEEEQEEHRDDALRFVKQSLRESCKAACRAVVLVVRNAKEHPSRASSQLLESLGLRRQYSAVFMRVDGVHCEMLNILDPFTFYGYPTKETIRNLFLTKGRFKPEGSVEGTPRDTSKSATVLQDCSQTMHNTNKPLPITNNLLVEQRLGHLGLLCLEDLIDEVAAAGDNFDAIQRELAPFRLCNKRAIEGVFFDRHCKGNYDAAINELVSKLC